MEINKYSNEVTSAPVDVGRGQAWATYPLIGSRVELEDGTLLPTEWRYWDGSAGPQEPWYVLEFTVGDDGVPRTTTVMICAQQDGRREVRASDLRRIRPLEHILEQSIDMIAMRSSVVVDKPVPIVPRDVIADAVARRRTVRSVRRADRRVFTEERAAEVAEVYVANMAGGSPTKAVREHFGIAESTASLYVKRARPLIDKKLKERHRGKR